MAINYQSLKISEKELQNYFMSYAKHILNMQEILLKLLKDEKAITPSIFKKVETMENKANEFEAEIMNECIWVISKDMPRANHLRFIIAIINSIKDLERMADYVIASVAIFYKSKQPKEMYRWGNQVWQKAHILFRAAYNQLLISTKNNGEFYRKVVVPSYNKFAKEYKNILKQVFAYLSKAKNHPAFQILDIFRDAERTASHMTNIVENFVFIREYMFYFEGKQHNTKFE